MLAFIGFIALLIFGKFLWDTYATGNTDKDWESYKRNEPEKAARIINSDTFDMSTDYKPNPRHQKDSLQILALTFECDASEVEENYKSIHREALAGGLGSVEQFKQAMNDLKHEKHKQAVQFKIDPDNTPAAFMERWMQEVLDEISHSKITVKDCLAKAAELASNNQHEDAVNFLHYTISKENSGEIVSDRALSPYLWKAFGDNYLILNDYTQSIKYFDWAIDSLKRFNANDKETLNYFIECRSKADEKYVTAKNYAESNSEKYEFFRILVDYNVTVEKAESNIENLKNRMKQEAINLGIAPNDTPSAHKVRWTKEYVADYLVNPKWKSRASVLNDFFNINPDYKRICDEGNDKAINDYLTIPFNIYFRIRLNAALKPFESNTKDYYSQSIKSIFNSRSEGKSNELYKSMQQKNTFEAGDEVAL